MIVDEHHTQDFKAFLMNFEKNDFYNFDKEDLLAFQFDLLKKQIKRVYEESRFYRNKFIQAGLHPNDIQQLSDIPKIPLTDREELEKNFENILAVPQNEISTIRMSSGTTGSPLKIAHTIQDLDMIANASARRLTYQGITKNDVIQITSAYGLWQGAWSMHWGAERVGACILPVGPAETERQILLIKQFGTTVLYGATNYHLRIMEVAKSMGEDLKTYKLKLAFCVAEKPSKSQIEALKRECGYQRVISDYGATEFPGFSVNCFSNGEAHHIWPDYYFVEIVDPKTHEPKKEGRKGELVITSLKRQAFPLIRYLSRDLTEFYGYRKCECGLFTQTISANIDREDSMIKIRGVTVFPSHLESLLTLYPQLTGRCQIIVDKRTPQHDVSLKVEVFGAVPSSEVQLLRSRIVTEVKSRVGIGINNIEFVTQGVLENKFKKAVTLT
jgi:phenylacetate-CoA ligase